MSKEFEGYRDMFHSPLLTREEEAALKQARNEAGITLYDDPYTASSKFMDAAHQAGLDITNLEVLAINGNPPRPLNYPGVTDAIQEIKQKLDSTETIVHPPEPTQPPTSDTEPEGDKS